MFLNKDHGKRRFRNDKIRKKVRVNREAYKRLHKKVDEFVKAAFTNEIPMCCATFTYMMKYLSEKANFLAESMEVVVELELKHGSKGASYFGIMRRALRSELTVVRLTVKEWEPIVGSENYYINLLKEKEHEIRALLFDLGHTYKEECMKEFA